MILREDFYLRDDVVRIAKDLLGKTLFTDIDGMRTSGIISETEAYAGISDRASHAFGGRLTNRTEIMFRKGGIAYVYLCYGIHSLFNVVTSTEGNPHAVLIRSVVPVDGTEIMKARTGKDVIGIKQGTGPGNVSRLLGVHYRHSGLSLCRKGISKPGEAIFWIDNAGIPISEEQIITGTRIGVGYAGEDAMLPFRFRIHKNLL